MSYLLKRPDIKTKCIWTILASKRMLAEHMEVVELCYEINLNRVTVRKPAFLRKTVYAGCVLTIAATTRFSPSYITSGWQMVAAASSALLIGGIAYEDFVFHRELAKIESLIMAFVQYDNTMKRALMYINETIFYMHKDNEYRDIDMIHNIISNCIMVILDINSYVLTLEIKTNVSEKYLDYYTPMESFKNREVINQSPCNYSKAKEVYNIFLYMQSHCLQRLSLAIDSDGNLDKVKLETFHMLDCVTSFTEKLKKEMLVIDVQQKHDFVPLANVMDPSLKKLSMVKHQSMELAAKLTANARQVLLLDENLQCLVSTQHGSMQLKETVNKLNTLQSCLLTRVDECQHLIIKVNNLLHITENAKQHQQVLEHEDTEEGTFEESNDEMQCTADEQQDEFFVNTGTDGEEDANESTACVPYGTTEEELVEKRLMKKRFKPVMEQLRERLIPVDETFRERERVALERKGIKMQDDEESHDGWNIASKPNTFDSDDESDVQELEAIFNRSQHKYNADRDFLAGKQQISLLASLPKRVEMEEDILE